MSALHARSHDPTSPFGLVRLAEILACPANYVHPSWLRATGLADASRSAVNLMLHRRLELGGTLDLDSIAAQRSEFLAMVIEHWAELPHLAYVMGLLTGRRAAVLEGEERVPSGSRLQELLKLPLVLPRLRLAGEGTGSAMHYGVACFNELLVDLPSALAERIKLLFDYEYRAGWECAPHLRSSERALLHRTLIWVREFTA
jgi:hypothetical protein